MKEISFLNPARKWGNGRSTLATAMLVFTPDFFSGCFDPDRSQMSEGLRV